METELEVPAEQSEWLPDTIETSRPTTAVRTVTSKPAPRWPQLDIPELWHYRELVRTLVWRDFAVRYKQTAIGIAWAIIVPFLTMVVFTLVFGKFANFPSKGVPYPIFTYSALLPWTYFASSVALASSCLVANRPLVTKV